MLKEIFICFLPVVLPLTSSDNRVITSLKYSKYYVKPTVVNGYEARIGQVPYLVSIKEPLRKNSYNITLWSNLCGGSIVTRMKVLTAAHCFELNGFYYAKHVNKLRVVAGNIRKDLRSIGNTDTRQYSQWREIASVAIHHRFDFPYNDIALVFVNLHFYFTEWVGYVAVATKNLDYMTDCISAGFGRTGSRTADTYSPVLIIAKIDLMTRSQCSHVWEMDMDGFICTYSLVTDVREGDSGGPLACRGVLDPEGTGRDVLVGIVSGKNFDKTTLYTRVSAYQDWINSNGTLTNRSFRLKTLWYLILLLIALEKLLQ